MFTTALIGCSGYAGQETLDRVLAHPELEVVALGSDSLAGEPPSALDLRLNGSLPAFVSNAEALASRADVLFLCLDHDEAAAIEPPANAVVVDLSGGHRLRDAALYDDWYGFAHPFPDALTEWSYAVPELYPPTTKLIANPGCYATAALLALAPLAGAIEPDGIVVDAKSGVSGAGRALKASSHAGFVLENLSPYRVGAHQHAPELEQALGFPVCFVPHLLPIRRGLLATCYMRATDGASRERLEDAYADSDVVREAAMLAMDRTIRSHRTRASHGFGGARRPAEASLCGMRAVVKDERAYERVTPRGLAAGSPRAHREAHDD